MHQYTIKDIKTQSPTSGGAYFLDANIWIFRLTSYSEEYDIFFDDILCNNAYIIVIPVLISQVFNTYMRIGFKEFMLHRGLTKAEYKKDYRPTQAYKDRFNIFQSEIDSYASNLRRVSDDCDPILKLASMRPDEDLNDIYYLDLCKKYNYTIVTDDKDFFQPYIEI